MTTDALLAQVPVQDIVTWRHYLHRVSDFYLRNIPKSGIATSD